MTVTAYARLASGPCPNVADLLLSVAGALGHVDGPATLELLDDHARALFGLPALEPRAAADRLVAVLVDELGFGVDRAGDADAWLLDRVVARRRGHPALLAVVAYELARRAGAPTAVLTGSDGWYVCMGDADAAVFVTFGGAARVPTPDTLRRHCAHELAFVVLTGLERAFERATDLAGARRAAGLRTLLPVAGTR